MNNRERRKDSKKKVDYKPVDQRQYQSHLRQLCEIATKFRKSAEFVGC